MREIKFRGKRIDNGEWAYGLLCKSNDDIEKKKEPIWYVVDERFRLYRVIPETIGQFTGLKDKNGKEIYEGDVLEVGRSYYRGHLAQFGRHKIVWDDNEPGFTYDNTEYRLTKNHVVVIVGNIHEGGKKE